MPIYEISITEQRCIYHALTLETPLGATEEQIESFAMETFAEHGGDVFEEADDISEGFDVFHADRADSKCEPRLQELRKADEKSIIASCMFRRWLETKELVERLAVVDPETSGYVGDGENGCHYTVKECGTFWYASAMVDRSHTTKDLFVDVGPFNNEPEAVDYCQIECAYWCGLNKIEMVENKDGL